MSELLRKAAESQEAIQQRDEYVRLLRLREVAKQTENRRRSAERANEFIGLMRERQVPTLPLYAQVVEKDFSRLRERSITVGCIFVANGWVIQERSDEYDRERQGLFLTEDGKTYGCWQVKDQPPFGTSLDEPDVPHVRAFREKLLGQEFVDPGMEAIYADEAGLAILATALVRYDAAASS